MDWAGTLIGLGIASVLIVLAQLALASARERYVTTGRWRRPK